MSKRRKWPPWATKSTCSHDKGGQRSDLLLGQYSMRESSHVIETCWLKAVKLAVNDRNRCDFFYTKWGNFFDWPQLVFNFTDSVQFKLGSLHACSAALCSILCKEENIWIHGDSCISSAEPPVHPYLWAECHADLYMTVFVFLTKLMGSAKASECVPLVLFIKPWFSFSHTQTWGGCGREGWRRRARQRRRRDTKRRVRDVNRSGTKKGDKRIDGIKEKRRKQKKDSYCKQVEPPAPPAVYATELAKALSFPTADSITFPKHR